MSIVFGALSLVLGSLAAWAITRSLTRPLEGAVKLADGIANGRLDNSIDASGNDEVTQLLRSMQRMQAQLQSVMAAQGELARQHDAGSLSYRMDESAFPGDYGRMVHETNALVGSHVQVQNRLIEVMKHYARGDLSVDMDPLPGEKAAITQAMDETKTSLSAINGEIRRLATAAAAGDFSLRGDEDRFAYEFRDMVAGLNRLMQTTDENLVQVSTLLQAISRGDLTVRMQGTSTACSPACVMTATPPSISSSRLSAVSSPARPASTWRQARSLRATPICRGAPSSRRRTWKRRLRRWRN